MNRVLRQVWAGVSALAGASVAVAAIPACVHDDSTIFVSEVLAPQLVTAGMGCTFTSDPSQLHITSGVLDTAIRGSYDAEFLVGNQIVAQVNPSSPATETSFVNIQGAVVRIVDSNGRQLTSFTEPTAITIPASSGTTPGYSPIGLTIIDAATVQSLAIQPGMTKTLVAYTRFFGKTLGGASVESNEFGFPVELCYGCLISFSPDCTAGSTTSTSSVMSSPCILGQDFPFDCKACSLPVCHPAGAFVDAGAD